MRNSFPSMLSRKTMTLLTAPLVLACLAAGCASGPAEIPDTLSAAELIQRGQEASDRSRYRAALSYYEAVTERYFLDIDSICAAEYEIAFIHYKQKKYEQSRAEFHALLGRYEETGGADLPPKFKRLAEMVLEKINAKLEPPR